MRVVYVESPVEAGNRDSSLIRKGAVAEFVALFFNEDGYGRGLDKGRKIDNNKKGSAQHQVVAISL